MYNYIVHFYWSGTGYTRLENNIVYDVDTRAEAIKAVKRHYGRGAVRVVSASRTYD